MTPKERIEAAKARKAQIESRLTPDIKKDMQEREEADRLEAEASNLEAKERAYKLDQVVERLKETFGPHIRGIDLESLNKGHGVWVIKPADGPIMKQFLADSKKPNADSDAMNRRVAEDCVIHYNGNDEEAIDGEAMHALWDTFGAIPTTLGNAAVEMGGFVADTRKSLR